MDFGLVWEGLGEVLGSILAPNKGPKRAKLIFSTKLRFSRDFGSSWEDLGRVWKRFWEGFGRVLGGFWDGLGVELCWVLHR